MGNFTEKYRFSKETYHKISQITEELITILPINILPTDGDIAIFTVSPVTTLPLRQFISPLAFSWYSHGPVVPVYF